MVLSYEAYPGPRRAARAAGGTRVEGKWRPRKSPQTLGESFEGEKGDGRKLDEAYGEVAYR